MRNAYMIDRIDVSKIDFELYLNPQLWNADTERTRQRLIGDIESPHRECDDIWVRCNDKRPFIEAGSYAGFNDPHFSIWYDAYYQLPSLNPIIWNLMTAFKGENLGTILINRVSPGKRIYPHVDLGWHAGFYDKFNVIIKGNPGSYFGWPDDNELVNLNTGDVFHFRNDTMHEVVNNSNEDVIILVVCIRTLKFGYRTPIAQGNDASNLLNVHHHFPTETNQVYIRQMSAPAGYRIATHKHAYDHYSVLGSGSVTVDVDGQSQEYTGPAVLLIEAGKVHSITARTPITWFCIHHTDEDDESKIDEVLIEKGD